MTITFLSDRDVRYMRRTPADESTNGSSSAAQKVVSGGQPDSVIFAAAVAWVATHTDSLEALARGWDSYGGLPLQHRAAELASHVVAPLLAEGLPAPALVPMSDGGLSIEWHMADRQLTVTIPAQAVSLASGSAYYANDAVGEEWESPILGAESRVRSALTGFQLAAD